MEDRLGSKQFASSHARRDARVVHSARVHGALARPVL